MTHATSTTAPDAPAAVPRAPLRTPWLLVGGIAIATLGVAAGLAWRPDAPAPVDGAVRASAVSGDSAVAPGRTTDEPMTDPARDAKGGDGPAKPAARRAPAQGAAGGETTPLAARRAAVCATCGVVENVRAVEQKGKGTGLGAVAGGVAGAVVGNQFGSGNGRAAMTAIGAIGGGVAGNEIEKRARSETVYQVRVRMDDGSVRTLTQKTAPAKGARVTVEGNTLRAARGPQA